MVKIDIRNLTFSYSNHEILDDVNLAAFGDSQPVGPNGSGKTALIKCIDRILKAEGSIFLDGRDINSMSGQEIARIIGYVLQTSSSPLSTNQVL